VKAETVVNGVQMLLDIAGALVWPARGTVVVADLHLEKGTGFAKHGTLLPPYDSRTTLKRLKGVLNRHRPERVIALGDSFHDGDAASRLPHDDAATLSRLTGELEWIWIAGNHDPQPPEEFGGTVTDEFTDGAVIFRHEAQAGPVFGEISGHFHPKAAVTVRGRSISAPCFVGDGRRLILPSFGSYTGGLDVHDPAIADLFERRFVVHMLGRNSIHQISQHGLRRPVRLSS